jgi:hypothetical protein
MQCSKIAEKRDERAPFHRPTLMGIADKLEQVFRAKLIRITFVCRGLRYSSGGNGAPVCELTDN